MGTARQAARGRVAHHMWRVYKPPPRVSGLKVALGVTATGMLVSMNQRTGFAMLFPAINHPPG